MPTRYWKSSSDVWVIRALSGDVELDGDCKVGRAVACMRPFSGSLVLMVVIVYVGKSTRLKEEECSSSHHQAQIHTFVYPGRGTTTRSARAQWHSVGSIAQSFNHRVCEDWFIKGFRSSKDKQWVKA